MPSASSATFLQRLKALPEALFAPSSRVGQGLLAGIFPSATGSPPARTTKGFLQAYNDSPWLRAVAGRVGTSVAQNHWSLYAPTRARRAASEATVQKVIAPLQRASGLVRRQLLAKALENEDVVEVPTHPLLDLLDNPCPYLPGLSVRKVTQVHLDVVGESFWALVRNPAMMPVEAWPVPPHWVVELPTPSRRTYRLSENALQAEIPDIDMLWFAEADPVQPYDRGAGVARALGDELDTDEYAAKHVKATFYNRARPDMLVYGEGIGEKEVQRLEATWRAKTQGFWRAFTPYFVNRKLDVTLIEQDFRHLQLVDLRKFERDTAMQVWGTPPEILGVLTNSNRSTIDSADYLYNSKVIVPRLEYLRALWQQRLVPFFDDRLILEYVSPVQEDYEFKLKVATQFPWTLTKDEVRALGGWSPSEAGDGDAVAVPTTVTVYRTLDEALGAADAVDGDGAEDEPGDEPTEPADGGAAADAAAGLVLAYRAPAPGPRLLPVTVDRERPAAEEKAAGAATVALARRHEPAVRREVLASFRTLEGGIDLVALANALDAQSPDGAQACVPFRAADLQLARRGGAALAGAYLRSAQAEARRLDAALASAARAAAKQVRFDPEDDQAVAWARQNAARLVRDISRETRVGLRQLIADSLEAGLAPRRAAREIEKLVGLTRRQAARVARFRAELKDRGLAVREITRRVESMGRVLRRQRAHLIAQTETMMAVHAGQERLWRQAAADGQLDLDRAVRVWIVTDDDRLDAEVCEPMDGQRRGIDEPFETGTGEELDRPPAHPGCRCTVGLRVKRRR